MHTFEHKQVEYVSMDQPIRIPEALPAIFKNPHS